MARGVGQFFSVMKLSCGRGLPSYRVRSERVIGVDVDDGILLHPFLDEKHVVGVNAPIPVMDQSIDLIVAHWVFEHVENPSQLAMEFFRVLKPGGWICARTPHRWSYVGIGDLPAPAGDTAYATPMDQARIPRGR